MLGVKEGEREGASKGGWKEAGYKRRVGGREQVDGGGGREREWEGESNGREVGSDDARLAESVNGDREG